MATLAQALPEVATESGPHHSGLEDLFLILRLPSGVRMDQDQFIQLLHDNDFCRIEQTAAGEIILMSPPVGETAFRELQLGRQLANWSDVDGTGVAFVSDTKFELPSGERRGPDAAWMLRARLAELTSQQKRKILPLAPDFLIELMSPSDRIAATKRKMQMWIDNGVRLAWMIDPDRRTVHVYSAEGVKKLDNPSSLSGEPVLPGFVLDLELIWTPGW